MVLASPVVTAFTGLGLGEFVSATFIQQLPQSIVEGDYKVSPHGDVS